MNGDPIVCGGLNVGSLGTECFHYERDIKNWKRVNL